MIYLYLFGTCFHFIYVFMIIGKIISCDCPEASSVLVRDERKVGVDDPVQGSDRR